MTTVQLLTQALALLRKYGWIQGRFGNRDVGFCMAGALSGTGDQLPFGARGAWLNTYAAARFALSKTIKAKYRSSVFNPGIPAFNDEAGRTFAEVQAVFEAAIARELKP